MARSAHPSFVSLLSEPRHLKLLLRICADQSGVVSRLIASNEDLISLLSTEGAQSKVMSGWRFYLFGKYACEFLEGKRILKIQDGKVISV